MKRFVVIAAAVTALLTSCGESESDGASAVDRTPSESKRPTVVASFYPAAEIADRLGSGVVEVENLTPAGVEPHDLELTPEQVDLVGSADLVLYVGHGFAPAIDKVVAGRTRTSIDLTSGMTLTKSDEEEHGHDHAGGEKDEAKSSDGLDPHFWLDPTLLSAASKAVEEQLVIIAPDNAQRIRDNANVYREELVGLDNEFRTGLASCDTKTIVTSHAAFGYLAARYGLDQHAVVLSPDSEPDAKALDELTDVIKKEGVTTVFSETLVSSRVADTLAREANVKTAVLNPIEGLTKDQERSRATYRSVMRDNLQTLRPALGCR